jgi:DNA-binding transcriptional regulator YhcF (GntR family)
VDQERPYLRIVRELRRRIEAGELRPGERVPSTRRIAQEWGVAMVTAARALARLREDGLVRAVPRVGTVVADPVEQVRPRAVRPVSGTGVDERARQRVVRAAITLADAEGVGALAMRRIATDLGMATMSLYRHVRGKDELIMHMVDMAFGDVPLPDRQPADWRANLALVLRLQWATYRRHPWLAKVMSFTRPPLAPNAMAVTEWTLQALDGYGLDHATMLHIAVTSANYVRGTAVNLEYEADARQDTGLSNDEWLEQLDPTFVRIMASGRFPMMADFAQRDEVDLGLDTLFEFGLTLLLDGVGRLLADPDR